MSRKIITCPPTQNRPLMLAYSVDPHDSAVFLTSNPRTSMLFTVKAHRLPHDGIIPGARGHKKIVVPRGTTVYTIEHGHLKFWAAYLDQPTALRIAQSLHDTATNNARRSIELPTLLAWNFKHAIPTRIARPK